MRKDAGTSKPPVERRRHRRAAIQLEAIFHSEGGEPVRLSVENFSVGGFFGRISRPIEPLTRLGVTFEFPPYGETAPRTVETSAVVVRCDPPENGRRGHSLAACFTDLRPEDRDHVERYVEWYRTVYAEEPEPEGTEAL